MSMQDTYINPFTDFGFKKLFGEEPNKELLISLLNTLLPDHHQIEDLEYTRNEQQGSSQLDRKAIFDLSCTSPTGERFIVELQKTKQKERVFKHLFKAAQIAQFEPKEREAYENSLKYYRDLKNVTDTAHEAGIEEGFEQGLERGREEGLEQGLEKGRQDVAKKMLQSGLSIEQIAELTGLTEPQVRTLT